MKMFPHSIRMQPTQPLSVPMVLRCRAMSQPRFSLMAPVSNIPPHQNTSGLKDVEKATEPLAMELPSVFHKPLEFTLPQQWHKQYFARV